MFESHKLFKFQFKMGTGVVGFSIELMCRSTIVRFGKLRGNCSKNFTNWSAVMKNKEYLSVLTFGMYTNFKSLSISLKQEASHSEISVRF